MTKHKVGTPVRVTIEGTVGAMFGKLDLNNDDSVQIDTEHGSIYLEADAYLKPFIEVIPEPLKDGLYYDGGGPLDVDYDQMSLVYKYEGGTWYDNRLDVIEPSAADVAKFVRLGPVGT